MRTTPNLSLTVWNLTGDLFNHTQLATNWDAIDAHNHATSGVQIPAGGLAVDAVGTTNIAALAVTTAKIADGSISTVKLANGSVTAAKLAAASAPNVVTTNYTLIASDANGVVESNSSSAIVVTVPPSVLVVGDVIEICRIGTGTLTLSPGAGVTLRSQSGALSVGHQYSSASLRCRATNDFVIVGDLA